MKLTRLLNFFRPAFAPPAPAPRYTKEVQTLLTAAGILRRAGWGQGGESPNGLCILSALALAQGVATWQRAIVPRSLLAALEERTWPWTAPSSGRHADPIKKNRVVIYDYNDRRCKSAIEAISLLERAAAIADGVRL